MNLQQIRDQLSALKAEYDEAACRRPITAEAMDQGERLRLQIVSLERKSREIQQLQYIVPMDEWNLKWTRSDTDVHLHALQGRAFAACKCHMVAEANPCVVTLEFESCAASRLTFIDYDELERHPLFDSGLEGLGAYCVHNSIWKEEVGVVASVSGCLHQLFCFNSCLVEVVGARAETHVLKISILEALAGFLSERK